MLGGCRAREPWPKSLLLAGATGKTTDREAAEAESSGDRPIPRGEHLPTGETGGPLSSAACQS